MLEKVWSDVNSYRYWEKNERILLAVSGGVDSMALLDVVRRIPEESRPTIEVVHVHHHLREDSDADLLLVKEYCERYNFLFHEKHWDPHFHPKSDLEAAAREFRYDFFSEKMKERNAAILLTAHHADDQMETILMKLTRGSALSGYSGILRERKFSIGKLIRPLLETEKEELYRYCLENNVPYREDSTNQELNFTRNRYRNQILPLIKKENEQAARHFQAFSQDFLDMTNIVEPVLKEKIATYFEKNHASWQFSIRLLENEPIALQRLLLTYFLEKIWSNEGVIAKKIHVALILELMYNKNPQSELSLSGGLIKKRYDTVIFEKTSGLEEDLKKFPTIYKELKLNQWLQLPINGKIGLFSFSKKSVAVGNEKIKVFQLSNKKIQYPLVVRNWQPGDRIQLNPREPFTKKLNRIFIDKKISKEDRDKILVISDANGIILWIIDYAASIWLTPIENDLTNNEDSEHRFVVFEK